MMTSTLGSPRCEAISKEHNHGKQRRALGDEECKRLDLDAVRGLLRPAFRAAVNQHHRQHGADQERSRIECASVGKQFGNEARGQFLKGWRKRTDRLSLKNRQRQPLEHQHAGQRHDKGRDLEIGHPVALRGTDQCTDQKAGDKGNRISDVIAHHQHRGDGADKTRDRTYRQVDMAGDDDQEHAERHDHDVAVLQHQVG
jgi:hypothetical protein